ncbi:MAG: hypothetical protein IPL55_19115 [Saprospiraceae bacterium]|jgi:hypothetical protein|nr:hypothetical protein [Saprospiraceae bacterium]
MQNNTFEIKSKEILKGFEMAYEKMVKFKKAKGTPLVVSENGMVKLIEPKDILPTTLYVR